MFYDEGYFGRKECRPERKNNAYKRKGKQKRWQATDKEFRCAHCKQMVFLTSVMGTVHRNHCPYCLHSLHVDTKPGNRASMCRARMMPIGLTWKHNGFDKYYNQRSDDIMLIHACSGCNIININRIAADDSCHVILEIFEHSLSMDREQKGSIRKAGILLLQSEDREQVKTALFGKKL